MKLFFPASLCIVMCMGSNDSFSEEDIRSIRKVLKGDASAYRLLVEKYWDPIFRYASSFLPVREEAEEAVQDIFVRGYRYLESFRLDQDFLPWMFGIASNRLRERYKRIKKQHQRKEEYRIYAGDDLPDYPGPEASVIEDQEKLEIRRAVEQLPLSLREPVYLYYFEEMDVAGIAAALGLSGENVKSRLYRGRKKLRTFLEELQPEQESGGMKG